MTPGNVQFLIFVAGIVAVILIRAAYLAFTHWADVRYEDDEEDDEDEE